MLTNKDIPDLKIRISQFVEEFKMSHEFIPGTTNINSYVALLCTMIYQNFFMPVEPEKSNTIIDLKDIELIKQVWYLYRNISLNFGSTCTLQRFISFSGISKEQIEKWLNGENRNGDFSETAKMFVSETESDLIGRAIDSNSIGAIFALKANYGYNDNQPQQINVSRIDAPQLTQEEIAKQLSILSDD